MSSKLWLTGMLILAMMVPTILHAEEAELPIGEEPPLLENCTDDFKRYIVADPEELMPNIDETLTVKFNLECDHESVTIEVLNDAEEVVTTLQSTSLSSGDHEIEWDGKINQTYAQDGSYKVKITPGGYYAQFAFSVDFDVYNFKYPALFDIYGESFKENLRDYRRENR